MVRRCVVAVNVTAEISGILVKFFKESLVAPIILNPILNLSIGCYEVCLSVYAGRNSVNLVAIFIDCFNAVNVFLLNNLVNARFSGFFTEVLKSPLNIGRGNTLSIAINSVFSVCSVKRNSVYDQELVLIVRLCRFIVGLAPCNVCIINNIKRLVVIPLPCVTVFQIFCSNILCFSAVT